MKRIFIFAIVGLVLATGSAFAAAGDMRVGLQGGVNLATSSVSNNNVSVSSIDARTGAIVGVFGEYGVWEWLHVRPELTYVQKGHKSGTVTSELDYFTVPLLLEAKFEQDEFRPFLFLGPNIGFKVAARDVTTTTSVDTSSQVESVDFAIDMGGGLEYVINKEWAAQLNIRYSLGLTDVAIPAATDSKTRGVQIMAGVSYGF